MQLPETNIPIVFKNNKLLDRRQKAQLKTIKASTLVGDLPLNTLVVSSSLYWTTYRYNGGRVYSYIQVQNHRIDNSTEVAGGADNFKILKEVMDTISTIKPFVSELFIS